MTANTWTMMPRIAKKCSPILPLFTFYIFLEGEEGEQRRTRFLLLKVIERVNLYPSRGYVYPFSLSREEEI